MLLSASTGEDSGCGDDDDGADEEADDEADDEDDDDGAGSRLAVWSVESESTGGGEETRSEAEEEGVSTPTLALSSTTASVPRAPADAGKADDDDDEDDDDDVDVVGVSFLLLVSTVAAPGALSGVDEDCELEPERSEDDEGTRAEGGDEFFASSLSLSALLFGKLDGAGKDDGGACCWDW